MNPIFFKITLYGFALMGLNLATGVTLLGLMAAGIIKLQGPPLPMWIALILSAWLIVVGVIGGIITTLRAEKS